MRKSKEELVLLSIEELNKELKRVSSLKCNLKKRKGVVDYNEALKELLSYDDLVKEVKYSLMNKGKTYYDYNSEDIEKLSIDELGRFRKGIASKKCLDGGDPEIYNRCEELLNISKEVLDRKRNSEEKSLVSKNDLRILLENFEMSSDVELLIQSLRGLVE